jgi:hypothetical protein
MDCRFFRLVPLIAAAVLLGACASDSPGLLPTASVTAPEEPAPKRETRVSAECISLGNQIQALRSEGSIDRLEKVAAGKGDAVQVKRSALAKQAELNKVNAEFQAKCGPRLPATTTAAAAPASTPAAAAKAVTKTPVASGVTVAPSAAKAN